MKDYKLDVIIMGVKKRAELISVLLDRTGLDMSNVLLDNRGFAGGGDAWYNAKRAWLAPIPEGVTHRLVIQDDVLVCDNFIEICKKVITVFPDAIWSLHSGVWITPNMKKTDSPYIKIRGCKTSGEAIIMPVEHIKPMMDWSDMVFGKDYKHDDGRIGFYAMAHSIPMFGTIPSLTEHLQVASCIPNHNCRKRIAKSWIGEDVGYQDWDNKDYSSSPFITNDIWVFKDKEKRKRLDAIIKEYIRIYKENEKAEERAKRNVKE